MRVVFSRTLPNNTQLPVKADTPSDASAGSKVRDGELSLLPCLACHPEGEDTQHVAH